MSYIRMALVCMRSCRACVLALELHLRKTHHMVVGVLCGSGAGQEQRGWARERFVDVGRGWLEASAVGTRVASCCLASPVLQIVVLSSGYFQSLLLLADVVFVAAAVDE